MNYWASTTEGLVNQWLVARNEKNQQTKLASEKFTSSPE